MFTKNSAIFLRLGFKVKVRWSRQIQSVAPGASYLYNPGSEPLVHATLGQVLDETARKYPKRDAVRSVFEDRTLTYEELLYQADALGCALRGLGLQKGDRLGIWSHNCTAWIIAMVAAARVGLITVAINPAYEKPELSFCIMKTGMKTLIIGKQLPKRNYYGLLRGLIPELEKSQAVALKSDKFPTLNSVVTCEKNSPPGTITLESLISGWGSSRDVTRFSREVSPEDGSFIHFTSGTTGQPKAALDSHLGLVNNTYFIGKRNTFHQGHHRVLLQAPIFHALGSVVTTFAALRHGATVVVGAPIYSVTDNFSALLKEKCTAITGTPTMFVDMLSEARRVGAVPSNLRVALAAGAPCSPQLIRDIQTYLRADSVLALYGMTETTASIFQSQPNDTIDLVADTVGYIQDHLEVKVVDSEGKVVPFGTPGELVCRGYANMVCYWDDPEKTRQTLRDDGWLHTGDTFIISEDGYGKIVGRIKDIIVRGGENIAPKEIEDCLNTHPDIIDSQVVGVPDARLGEELCAVIRLHPGAVVTLEHIRDHCSGRIARFKIPRILKITEDFPKTASGKIQKNRIREMIDSGKL